MTRSKILIATFFLFLSSTLVHGQAVRAVLLGEGNGKTVKLLWLPGNWPKGTQAFFIKRRAINGTQKGDWEIVGGKAVLPGLSVDKDLSNVESNTKEQQRLQKKLADLEAAGRAREIPTLDYLKKLKTDSNAIRAFPLIFALDYDFALLNGFAMIDRNIPEAEAYEYGLFPVVNSKVPSQPISTYKWKYGSELNIDLPLSITLNPNGKKTLVEIQWIFSSIDFKEQNLNGFNVYRKEGKGNYKKLNQTPLWVNLEDKAPMASFIDSAVKPNTIYTYAVAPLTLFGTEGSSTEAKYDPAQFLALIPAPDLKTVDTTDKAQFIPFVWNFDAGMESLIKGFVLEKYNDKLNQFEEVSALLPPGSRSYTDAKNLVSNSYYRYRLAVWRMNGQKIYSQERLVYYKPVLAPAAPGGLTAKWTKEGDHSYIILQWDAKKPNDTLTVGYRLYSSFPPDNKLAWETNIPLIKDNKYKYEIFSPSSARYYFAISAVNKDKDESDLSKTVEVVTPTTSMPVIQITNVSLDSNKVTLNWKYGALPDLKGFRIYMNGSLVADADRLNASARQWISTPLPAGQTYTFEVQSISTYGIMSEKSYPITLTVENPKKH